MWLKFMETCHFLLPDQKYCSHPSADLGRTMLISAGSATAIKQSPSPKSHSEPYRQTKTFDILSMHSPEKKHERGKGPFCSVKSSSRGQFPLRQFFRVNWLLQWCAKQRCTRGQKYSPSLHADTSGPDFRNVEQG